MEVAPMDLSASTQPRNDLNGNPCALVKVQLPIEGASFEGNVLGEAAFKQGEYWVYMSEGSYLLQVKHSSFYPMMVNFRDYDIRKVESKTTYILTIGMSQPVQQSIIKKQNQESQVSPSSTPEIETFTVNGVSFNMVRVEGGTFSMGSNASIGESPAHQVTLSTYSIGETEVTQELWQAVMGKNPSSSKDANIPHLPVESVSWKDCQRFIKKLNKLTNKSFRLPTEAEWEFAARGGNMSQGYKYAGSNQIDEVAWYTDNSHSQNHVVKTKKPNELGLYDMTGNVSEWCEDWYGRYNSNPQTNPTGPTKGYGRVQRGGCRISSAEYCRISDRQGHEPDESWSIFGFRLALSNAN
jgi:formylglycine-generating enzyme required for sulfatase activity